MFSVHTTPAKFENGANTLQFRIVFAENSAIEGVHTRDYCDVIVYEKFRFQNGFRPDTTTGVFKFFRLSKCISEGYRPNYSRNKAAFSNYFSRVEWKGPKPFVKYRSRSHRV